MSKDGLAHSPASGLPVQPQHLEGIEDLQEACRSEAETDRECFRDILGEVASSAAPAVATEGIVLQQSSATPHAAETLATPVYHEKARHSEEPVTSATAAHHALIAGSTDVSAALTASAGQPLPLLGVSQQVCPDRSNQRCEQMHQAALSYCIGMQSDGTGTSLHFCVYASIYVCVCKTVCVCFFRQENPLDDTTSKYLYTAFMVADLVATGNIRLLVSWSLRTADLVLNPDCQSSRVALKIILQTSGLHQSNDLMTPAQSSCLRQKTSPAEECLVAAKCQRCMYSQNHQAPRCCINNTCI